MAKEWYSPDMPDADWATLGAGQSWQLQGYPNYQGTGWYRRSFASPSANSGERILMLFGGVDGDVELWLNGKRIGGRGLIDENGLNHWDIPFSADITQHLRPKGELSSVSLRVLKTAGHEGLHRPVRLFRVTADEHPQGEFTYCLSVGYGNWPYLGYAPNHPSTSSGWNTRLHEITNPSQTIVIGSNHEGWPERRRGRRFFLVSIGRRPACSRRH